MTLPRILILLLLVCDWVGDPHHGQSPLSRCWSSQEVSCHSLAYRQDSPFLAWAQGLLPAALNALPGVRPETLRQHEAGPPSPSGPDLLYALRALRL